MVRSTFQSVCLAAIVAATSAQAAGQWQAGVARVNITPDESMWMSGYASRDRPAEGKRHDLWAKALVLVEGAGHRAVLVTMDLVGIERSLSQEVCQQIEQKLNVPRAAIILAASHTHTGPVIRSNLAPIYQLDERQTAILKEYGEQLADKLVDVVVQANERLQPAQLSWANGLSTFAVNRRNNVEQNVLERRRLGQLVGPVDHDVPVLAVRNATGELFAVVGGYACHATVLGDYLWSGDWPGAAQIELERRHPGVTALYWAGCGGDQNPLPRKTPELLEQYGHEFADAVDAVLAAPMAPLTPTLTAKYEEIALPFAELPTRGELQSVATSDPPRARWAKLLLEEWDRRGELKPSYPYPLQAWKFGDDLNWVILGGEAVVDYSIRIKHELGRDDTWVTSYANDVMAYIPSRRVLGEGGYEGTESRFVYGLPAPWDPSVEQVIIDAIRALTAASD